MLQGLLSSVYGLLHGAQGPLFTEQIYPQIGAALLGLTLLSGLLYYYVFGWTTATLNMTRHWVIALVINAVLCMVTVVGISRFELGGFDVDAPIVMSLVLIQGLYAALLFVIMSALIKWGSPNARCTPF
jgi:hypothetical protein